MPQLILFNKPYGVLSQFRPDANNNYRTLSDFFTNPRLRVAGRLDATSEGLLLLTDHGGLNQALTHPPALTHAKPTPQKSKTYWVQLEGEASDEQIQQLATGVLLKDGLTLPAHVERLPANAADKLWQAAPNIAKRATTCWLAITIVEGKNRQVRRMTASVGLPCLRLIRVAMGGFLLDGLAVGQWRSVPINAALLRQFGLNHLKKSPLPHKPKSV